MTTPVLVMVAGPNGSGKSTLTESLRASPDIQLPRVYINADEIQRSQGLDVVAAQRTAAQLRSRAIAAGQDVMYETVMSHPSKLAELQRAKAAGYRVVIHFVATQDPSINVQRVALRVAAGGHDVPAERTRRRYARTMALGPSALGYADEAFVFDNSRRGAEGGMQLQSQLVGNRLALTTESPAPWVEQLATCMRERADELIEIRVGAQARGSAPHAALLSGSVTGGPIEMLAQHYAAQFDLGARTLVLHDRALLPNGHQLKLGDDYRIAYDDGVSSFLGD